MSRPGLEEARAVASAWGLTDGVTVAPVTTGHVNESFRVAGGGRALLLQWLNPEAFADPDAVQDNVERVACHLAAAAPALPRPELLETVDGTFRHRTGSGLWRAWGWLDGYRTLTRVDGPDRAAAAGAAFGRFLRALEGLPRTALAEILPAFQDPGRRLRELDGAVAGATDARRKEAAPLLALVEERRGGIAPLAGPPRVLHGDPKLSNVLFPEPTDPAATGPAVIDYDTILVGPLAWDFGDFLRSTAARGEEDDPEAAGVDPALLEAAAAAFLVAGPAPVREETGELARAPAVIAFTLAVRFLADHLAGDRYFRVRRPGQNLDRARTQLRLADDFAAQE
ncbi:MAG: phosphotransferase, partial [Pseudomonadales bacterium]|nr:phosphotransferase [Pseudomonadales bacterium]